MKLDGGSDVREVAAVDVVEIDLTEMEEGGFRIL